MTVQFEPVALSAARQAADLDPVQPTAWGERDQVRQIAADSQVFDRIELDTVDELLDGYFRDPQASGYNFLSYRDGDRVLGFVAWGPRDLSEHGYELYWIATRPDARRRGVARVLMERVEAIVRARGGGWIVIETSDTPPYAAARGFYARCGYQRLAVLSDFYRAGDGLVIYARRLNSKEAVR